MIFRTMTVSAYGFPLFADGNEPAVIRFILDRIESYATATSEDVADAVRSRLEEILVRYKDEDEYDCEGIRYALDEVFDFYAAQAVAEIISAETGLTFKGFQSDDYGTDDCVLYVRNYPWESSPADASLTKDELEGMCRSLCACLGIPETEIGEKTLYYYYR